MGGYGPSWPNGLTGSRAGPPLTDIMLRIPWHGPTVVEPGSVAGLRAFIRFLRQGTHTIVSLAFARTLHYCMDGEKMTNDIILWYTGSRLWTEWSRLTQGSSSLLMIDLQRKAFIHHFNQPEPQRHHQPYLAVTVPAQNPPSLVTIKGLLSSEALHHRGDCRCAICYLIQEEWSTCPMRESAHFQKTMKMKYWTVCNAAFERFSVLHDGNDDCS